MGDKRGGSDAVRTGRARRDATPDLSGVALVTRRVPGPIIGVALHCAHEVRAEVARVLALDDATRLREEDPCTDTWAQLADLSIVATHSRFEVDLNRPRERAVYLDPADAWGLQPWRDAPPADLVERSRALHDRFYAGLRALLDEVAERCGRFVVLDVHSYNHRRGGPSASIDDPAANPELNVGTGSMDRRAWAPIVEGFMAAIGHQSVLGRPLDTRENVRFRGGYLSRWIHATYPGRGCALALEWKKTYMDEWSGHVAPEVVADITRALSAAVTALRDTLRSV